VDTVGTPLDELSPGESLRERLTAGSFAQLLPLIQFLRDIGASSWQRPPLRAALIIHDPNLHWHSYGYIDYRRLATETREHGYHAVIATVPLDAWFVHQGAAQIFRENSAHLSLAVHGNNHLRNELGRLQSNEEARQLLNQAIHRVQRLERKTKISVARVMVPPHEQFSVYAARALAHSRFEALCASRAYPWAGDPAHPFAAAPDARAISGWVLADFGEGALPILLRRSMHEHDEIVLRSYLQLPILLDAHASDYDGCPDVLTKAADFVNDQGPVQWMSLPRILRSNFEYRSTGTTLEVRPFARTVVIRLPDQTTEVRVVRPPGAAEVSFGFAVEDGVETVEVADDFVRLGRRRIDCAAELTISMSVAVDEGTTFSHRATARALTRRLLTEGRDRIQPILSKRESTTVRGH
jgi:hypothetical protein